MLEQPEAKEDQAAGRRGGIRPRKSRRVRIDTKGSLLWRALSDLWAGFIDVRLWGMLAWSDIRQQYKRSTLGPLWITLSTAIFVIALGSLYANLFNRPANVYIPYLTAGVIAWRLISGIVEQGCKTFINAEGIIKQIFAPLSVHAYRVVAFNLLVAVHNAILFVGVALVFGLTPTTNWLLAIPGLGLIALTGGWVALLLGTFSARFRDIPQIVQSVTQIMFFITPVLWMTEAMPNRALFLQLNPFYHFIELVRAPLLNQTVDPIHWQVAGGLCLFGWMMTLAAYSRFRARVAYWL